MTDRDHTDSEPNESQDQGDQPPKASVDPPGVEKSDAFGYPRPTSDRIWPTGEAPVTWQPARGPVARLLAALVLLMMLAGIAIMIHWSIMMFRGETVDFLDRLFPAVGEVEDEAIQDEPEP
ncbi:MAG: hypothetical protein JJU36_17045 [Phycisphaeraceae bacterium]|nr:hypothetical protein [Phycisphaeraceae bacterium]